MRSRFLVSFRRSLSFKRISETVEPSESRVVVQGWIRSIRRQKEIAFVDVNDGSTLRSLQVIAGENLNVDNLCIGTSVRIGGNLTPSFHRGQLVELKADEITVLGQCNPKEYPFKAKRRHSLDYIRQHPHLKSRTSFFSSVLRAKNAASVALHAFLQESGYIQVHTPVLTTNDCEELGDLFQVEPQSYFEASSDRRSHFFGTPVFLTGSGQLHAELLACGLGSVYTFGPTFRAEKSHTRRHLAEFWMLEPESCRLDSMENLTNFIENCLKCTLKSCLSKCEADVYFVSDYSSQGENKSLVHLESAIEKPYLRISYTEAIRILESSNETFEFEPKWGCDLQSEHERFIVRYCNNTPVFVTDFPIELKPFYARDNGDNTAAAVDLLVPGVGELVGGSVREERLENLSYRMRKKGIDTDYDWYLDMAKFGAMPHGGFGLGFERFLQYLLGLDNIRDVISFPRFLGSCKY
ncbi:asparaginyl-tRNA synthetase-like [Oscarella lobularis]|uniref:asparaginyl-tRNA synthetase-like n=1 Tax=Oscarella lobularis TaxID=121494 RepID=UPI00331416CB